MKEFVDSSFENDVMFSLNVKYLNTNYNINF